MEKELLEISNELETLRYKFRCPTDKKAKAEFNKKVNEFKDKLLLIIKQCQ